METLVFGKNLKNRGEFVFRAPFFSDFCHIDHKRQNKTAHLLYVFLSSQIDGAVMYQTNRCDHDFFEKGEIKVSKNGLGLKFTFTGTLDLKELL